MCNDVCMVTTSVYFRKNKSDSDAAWIGIIRVVRDLGETCRVREADDDRRGWLVEM